MTISFIFSNNLEFLSFFFLRFVLFSLTKCL